MNQNPSVTAFEPSATQSETSPTEPRRVTSGKRGNWLAPVGLLGALVAVALLLVWWKQGALAQAEAVAANQPEPMESVTVAVAEEREFQPKSTSIGTVVALQSVTLRNELPGTVREVNLQPGEIVDPGTALVVLDVSVERAELNALQSQAALAETLLARMEKAVESRAFSQMELDRARAELEVANAQIARLEAVIERKTVRAPFRARVGISDVHPGQYLNEGTLLTTLQGVSDSVHVDFSVSQQVARWLDENTPVEVFVDSDLEAIPAEVVALDSKVDPDTRNTMVRARVQEGDRVPAPGASVRVRVPAGRSIAAVGIPVSALRKGPSGDHVFMVGTGEDGQPRARMSHVQTATVVGDDVLVVSGLKPGDRVAATGSFKLRDQALVAVANEGGSEPMAQ